MIAVINRNTVYMDTCIFQAIENSLQGSLLVETDIRVSITVLDTNDVVADNGYSWSIAKKLLVSGLGIELLCLHVRSLGCNERCFIRRVDTSSMHVPP